MRVVIVDDEGLSRELVREFLKKHSDVEIVGEAENGFEAVKIISETQPELVFLDIQMPKLTGFEVLELVGPQQPVVFITAYDQYALKAFEINAVDYLLKPFNQERLDRALERFRTRAVPVDQQRRLVESVRVADKSTARILIKDGSTVIVIPADRIDYIRAQDDYAEIFADGRSYLKQQTLTHLESCLDPQRFVRIHRSYLVNLDKVARVEPASKDNKVLVLKNGTEIPVSRSGYEKIRKLF